MCSSIALDSSSVVVPSSSFLISLHPPGGNLGARIGTAVLVPKVANCPSLLKNLEIGGFMSLYIFFLRVELMGTIPHPNMILFCANFRKSGCLIIFMILRPSESYFVREAALSMSFRFKYGSHLYNQYLLP